MPRELRVDYAGNSFRWFDTDEMLQVHGSKLSSFLATSIEEHFKVPTKYQVLCDIEGPLSSSDFERLLRNETPKLWLFDARYMPEDLRKQCEERARLQTQRPPAGCLPSGSEPLCTLVEKSDTEAQLSTLSEREQQVSQLLLEKDEEIQRLQMELHTSSSPVDSDETSLRLLEAEEATLVESVQDALRRIGQQRRTFSAPGAGFPVGAGGAELSGQRTLCSETELTTASPSSLWNPKFSKYEVDRTSPENEAKRLSRLSGASGPLPPVESLEVSSFSCRAQASAKDEELSELQNALASAEHAAQSEARRASLAERALNEEQAEVLQTQLRCKLELDVAMRDKDLAHVQELREIQQRIHQSEMQKQAEVLNLKHKVANSAEQEEWQQMEILLLKSQQRRSERAQLEELQDLMSSVELERLQQGEYRASQLSAKQAKEKELSARLVGREMEILALENAMEAEAQRRQRSFIQPEELRKAREESSQLAFQLLSEAEMLRREESTQQKHLAEMAQQRQELDEFKSREAALQLRLQQLETRLAAAEQAPPTPKAPEAPEAPAPVEQRKSDYISTADDELDKALEKELFELGPGVLKGTILERTGPKRYKFGEQKIFMQLSDSKVTVRVGGGYVPLAQWTKELSSNGDDPFSALDATSPFAAVGR